MNDLGGIFNSIGSNDLIPGQRRISLRRLALIAPIMPLKYLIKSH